MDATHESQFFQKFEKLEVWRFVVLTAHINDCWTASRNGGHNFQCLSTYRAKEWILHRQVAQFRTNYAVVNQALTNRRSDEYFISRHFIVVFTVSR